MKKLLIVLAATTAVSTPAMAADYQGQTYGQDAIGLYDLKANVDTFCKFGTNTFGETVTNAVVTPGAPGSAAEGDGTYQLDIQNDSDNTVQEAFGRFKFTNAVCNTAHETAFQSQNGGLKTAASTSDDAFLEVVPYNVVILFDGNAGSPISSSAATSERTAMTVREARAGALEVNVQVPAQDKLLIQGQYYDRLTAKIRPLV